MSEPRITALLPLKNYEFTFLKKAVESMANQSCPDWALLIIVEDSDFENFKSILAQELTDPRVRIIKNEGRRLAGALNSGMRHAQTDFVAILLGDDMWSPDAVEVLTRYIDNFPDADFFHSSRRYIDDNGEAISTVYCSRERFSLEDFVLSHPVHHLLCWKKEKALAFGGMDETLNYVGPDDYDFPWSMAERGASFKAISECLYLYRDHRKSYRLTTHIPLREQIKEVRRIMRKHGASRASIRKKVATAKRSYLQQCLYRSNFDRWVKERLGYQPRHSWREKYQ